MSIEITGLKEFIGQLDQMQEKAKKLEGENNIQINELLNEEFLTKYSNFISIRQMFENYKEDITDDTVDDILNSSEWNNYIAVNSQFDNWNEMYGKALEIWTMAQLGFD